MKSARSILTPGLVLFAAVLSGGWFLQKGVSQERNVYLQVRLFEEVVDHVARAYVEPVEREELYQSAIDGILENLGDPNTSFMQARDVENFRIRMEGEYGGVGLEVIPRDGWVTVVTPLPGTPGTRAGIRTGDQIVEVGGESVEGWEPDAVVDALRGRPGTDVELRIRRPGVEGPIPFTVTRAVIQLHSVPFALTLQDGIGYVPLQSVSETSFREVKAAVDSLRGEGIGKLILDLRGNPGGALDQGVAITDLFLEPGQAIVDTRGRAANQSETYSAYENQPYPELAVVVLVDEQSASASEIIAGALQDHDRAVVVGAPTFGKGSVQTLFPLTGGNILRLTTARWYTPVGRSIHKEREDQIEALEKGILTLSGVAVRPDTTPKPVFVTEGGRQLFGGGGITPDVLVMADTLTLAEREAVMELGRFGGAFNTAVFNFAVAYLRENPGATENFRLGMEELTAFQRALEEVGVELAPSHFRQAERFIRYHLEREIALQGWGDAGEFLRILPSDRLLQRALALLRESATTQELLRAAARPELSDWEPRMAQEPAPGAEPTARDPVPQAEALPREPEGEAPPEVREAQ